MNTDEEFLVVFLVLVTAGIIVGLLVMLFTYFGGVLNEYNEKKECENKKKKIAQLHDETLMSQAKEHSIQYTENDLRDIKDYEFKFDLNDVKLEISNIGDSVVKTEVIYAD